MAPSLSLSDPELLRTKGWIDGKDAEAVSKKTTTLIDPATGEGWIDVVDMDEQDTERAIAAASKAFAEYSNILPRERAKLLLNLHNHFEAAKADLAKIMVMETGKPLAEAEGEMDFAADCGWFMIGETERIQGETIRALDNHSMRYFTIREPIGPVGLLTPWNFPMELAYRKMTAALAAGCTLVLKPAPETPVGAAALGLLAKRAGFADGIVNVVLSSNANTPNVGKKLCEDLRIKKISFTGSTRVGQIIAQQCAPSLKKLTLELGGNGAWTIFEDADLTRSVEDLVLNKFRNAGQVCVSANRVYVQRSVLSKVTQLLKDRVKALKIGHGLDNDTTIGPLSTERGVERSVSLVKDAVDSGAKVLLGGQRTGSGYHFEPTILVDAPLNAQVHRTEMFAPIVSLYAFDTEDEVVALVNDTDMGLTNYVWTADMGRAWRCFERMKSGQVALNSRSGSAVEAPFGGIKQSGVGKEGGYKYGVEDFCVVRTAALRI